jgi:hypothetical protein
VGVSCRLGLPGAAVLRVVSPGSSGRSALKRGRRRARPLEHVDGLNPPGQLSPDRRPATGICHEHVTRDDRAGIRRAGRLVVRPSLLLSRQARCPRHHAADNRQATADRATAVLASLPRQPALAGSCARDGVPGGRHTCRRCRLAIRHQCRDAVHVNVRRWSACLISRRCRWSGTLAPTVARM